MNEGLGQRASWIVAMLVLLAVGRWSWGLKQRRRKTDAAPEVGADYWLMFVALAMGIPLLVFQLVYSRSDNVRHMTPAYLPLTLALVLSTGRLLVKSWSWLVLIAFAYLSFVQVNREFIPLTNTPDDVWNWEPLYQICQAHHLCWPYIGRVGNAGQFCEPSIVYPWIKRGNWADCIWLWRSEEGTFDFAKVQQKLADRDLVLTAPDFHMPRQASMLADPLETDNAHNGDFQQRMLADPQWELAEKFPIGVVNPAEIWVFVRKVPLTRQRLSR